MCPKPIHRMRETHMHESPPQPDAPLTFGQTLDRIFRLLQSKFRLFIGIAALPGGAVIVVYGTILAAMGFAGALSRAVGSANLDAVTPVVFPAMTLGCLPLLAIYAIYWAAASFAAVQADRGVSVTFRASYALAWRQAGRYTWLIVLFGIYVSPPLLVIALVAGLGVLVAQPLGGLASSSLTLFLLLPVGILVYFGALVYAILLSLRFSLAFPASIEEDLTAREALRRSAQLTRGAKGRIFLVLLVIYAASYALFLVFLALLAGIFAVAFLAGTLWHMQFTGPFAKIGIGLAILCMAAGLFLYLAITYSGYSTALAVLYNQQRRREVAANSVQPQTEAPA